MELTTFPRGSIICNYENTWAEVYIYYFQILEAIDGNLVVCCPVWAFNTGLTKVRVLDHARGDGNTTEFSLNGEI